MDYKFGFKHFAGNLKEDRIISCMIRKGWLQKRCCFKRKQRKENSVLGIGIREKPALPTLISAPTPAAPRNMTEKTSRQATPSP